jgi:5,10-methenyltetrahydromethanopterin hydrogenase
MVTRPPAPYAPQFTSNNPRDLLRQIGDALSRKADVTSEPVYTAVLLIAPGGATYRVTVDDAGALSAAAVPR